MNMSNSNNGDKIQVSSLKGNSSLNYERLTSHTKGKGLQRSTSVSYEKSVSITKERLQRNGSVTFNKSTLSKYKSRFQLSENVSARKDVSLFRQNLLHQSKSTEPNNEVVFMKPAVGVASHNYRESKEVSASQTSLLHSRGEISNSISYTTAPSGSQYFTPSSSLKGDLLSRFASKPAKQTSSSSLKLSSKYSSSATAVDSSSCHNIQSKHGGRKEHSSQLVERMMTSDLSSGVSKLDDTTLSHNETHKSLSSLTLGRSKCRNLSREDFSIGSPLGKGRFGKVFLAKHIPSGFICALKVLCKDDIKHTLESSFQNEVNLHGMISNPNILQFYGVFCDAKYIYLVLEYAPQGDLYSKIRASGRFPEDTAVKYIVQIINAVMHLHNNYILHRDLKLENILIGHDGRLLLSDFGYAVQDRKPRRSMVGTPDYISPEIVCGRSYGRASDMWAVGVISYELLTSYTPFEVLGDTDATEEIYARISKLDLKFPDYISPLAVDFISKLLKRDPYERMSCEEALRHEWIASVFKED
ncbi:spindle assembly checkpoint kinase [Entomophthora muscae]|uniref:Spindle assembly checkpoint kinase n=1 Tax=Entomophthora muscae TaxID=34485 RepID=A0ACC2T1X9_9FUNG|nr:spindle assembly checkpoint kinase [Entomophthora muscae]